MKATVSKLGDAIDVLSGFAYEAELFNETEGLPVIRIRDVVRGFSNTRYSGDVDARFIVKNGEILIGMDGNFNTARWTGGPALLNQRVCKVTARADILDEGFLFHLLPKELKKIEDTTAFVTVKHLSVKGIRDIDIALPSLPEQRRIAAILDQADALRAKRREALAQLDSLTQSIFMEMFGDPATNSKMWGTSSVEQLAEQVTDGEHLTPKREPQGIKLLSARNVRNGFIDFGNVDYIGMDEHERIKRRCNPVRGDLLISCSGSIGRVASVETDEPFSLVRSVAMIRPKKDVILTKYLEHYLRTPVMNAHMIRRANASSQANLFQGPIREMPVMLPTYSLQQAFATRIQSVGALKVSHQAALQELDRLFASLQHRAFRGEL